MKFKTLLIIFSFIIARSDAQFYFCPQAGLGVASLNETEFNVNSKFAYHGGLMFNIPFTHHLSVMTGALYSSKRFKYDYVTATRTTQQNGPAVDTILIDIGVKGDATLGSLNIPIILTFYFSDQRGFFIQAGPQYSYLLTSTAIVNTSTTYSVVSGYSTPPAPAQTEGTLEFNKSDLALVGGIGYKLPSFLLVYACATTGFMKVVDDEMVKDENAGRFL